MIIKNKSLFFGVLFVFFIVGCGKKKENINPQVDVAVTKSYFAANFYVQSRSSILYSFDFTTNKVEPVNIPPSSSGDGIVFQKYDNTNNLQGVYFAERFSMQKPSRVTYYQALLNDKGKENTSFPMNLYSLMFVANKLIGIGYDKGEIIQTDLTMQTSYLKKIEVAGLFGKNIASSNSSANLNSLLYSNGKVFTISNGSYLDQNVKPYIYQLSDDLKSVEKYWPINNCFNASKHFKVIDESKLIISCNPFENDLPQNILNVFLIDVSLVTSKQEPSIITILEKQRGDDGIQQIDVGGISADRNSIFVSERKKLNSEDKYSYKALITSYWINLSNPASILVNEIGRQTPVNSVSGSVTYNYAAKSYLFSCVIDPSDSTCVKGKGAVSQSKEALSRVQVDLGIKGNDDLKFPIPVF